MLFSNKKFIGLSIDILEDETRLINYVCLKRRGKDLSIVDRKQNLQSIKELQGVFDSDSFVFLSINGKGIINKKIITNPAHLDTSQDKLVSLVLPNAITSDFYAQKFNSTNSFFVAVCRKNLVDNILSELEMVSCFPIKLCVGPYEINNILALIENNTLNTNTYQIRVEGQEVHEIQKLNAPESIDYTIEGEKINSSEILAFSAAIAGSLEQYDLANEFELIEANRKNISFGFQFKKKLVTSLLIVFGILLLNFLVYDFLFTKLESSKKINRDVAQSQMASIKTQEEFKQKKQFIVQKNWNANASISEIIELLSSSAPNGLTIKEINYQPENYKKTNATNSLKFQYKKVHVFGNVSNSNQLNSWMNLLVESRYFMDVSLQNYQLNTTGVGNVFNLEILLK